MFQILEKFADIIMTVIDIAVMIVQNLIMLVKYMILAPFYINQALAFIPAFITVPILAIIAFSLIVNIINKGG